MSEPLSPAGWLRGIHFQFEGITSTGIFEDFDIPPQLRALLPWRRCIARSGRRCQRPAGHNGGHYWHRWRTTLAWGWDYPWSIGA